MGEAENFHLCPRPWAQGQRFWLGMSTRQALTHNEHLGAALTSLREGATLSPGPGAPVTAVRAC